MSEILRLLIRPLGETILMIAASTLISTILGGGLGILLFTLSQDRFAGKYPGALLVKRIADRAINMFRSFPYVILMVLVLPLSRIIVGTSLGTIASIVPLSIAAIPFLARIVESSLSESLISGLTLTMISLLGYSAMAGVIGGGGLGDLAIRYGYQRFRADVMAVAVVAIVALVELIQWTGSMIIKRIKAAR